MSIKSSGKRGETVALYINKNLLEELKKLAKEQGRSVSSVANNLMSQSIEAINA